MELWRCEWLHSSSRCPQNRPGPWPQVLREAVSLWSALTSGRDAGCWCPPAAPSPFLISYSPAAAWGPAFQLFKNQKVFVAWCRICFSSTEQNPGRWDSPPGAAGSLDACRLPSEGQLLWEGVRFRQHIKWMEERKRDKQMTREHPDFAFYLSI